MSREQSEAPEHPDRLDADAVCAQCQTVNPDGTFICKTCGNNLRDQRALRLTADQAMMLGGESIKWRQWLSRALTLLGLLIVVGTALNPDRIADWLMPSQSASAALWTGTDSSVFEEMASTILRVVSVPEQVRALQLNPIRGESIEGRYVLVSSAGRILGRVAVRRQGAEIFFVARLANGGEVRGRAQYQGNALKAGPESAGVRLSNKYYSISGVALEQADGTFNCFGNSQLSEISHKFTAYRLPEQ